MLKLKLWTLKIDNNNYSTWKKILKAREHGLYYTRGVISNGENNFLLFDPWISDKIVVDLLGWDKVEISGRANFKVNSIIRDEQLVPSIFPI